MRFKTATEAERAAAFEAVHEKLHAVIEQWVPPFFKRQAAEKLDSQEGRDLTLEVMDAALQAAEEVRNAKAKGEGK